MQEGAIDLVHAQLLHCLNRDKIATQVLGLQQACIKLLRFDRKERVDEVGGWSSPGGALPIQMPSMNKSDDG